jgi:SHAQKYF class myb-like DNA-binding protein
MSSQEEQESQISGLKELSDAHLSSSSEKNVSSASEQGDNDSVQQEKLLNFVLDQSHRGQGLKFTRQTPAMMSGAKPGRWTEEEH